MYNGIGLTTPRGSGTNGHVQRNWALVRPGKKDNTNYRSEEDIKKLDAAMNRAPNKEILDHDRKRKIEVKCMEFEEILEKQGRTPNEIQSKVDSYRIKLLGHGKTEYPKDEFGRISVRETHQIAEAQLEKNAKLREAFNISDYFVEGSSFDSDRNAKETLARSQALQKALEEQRESGTTAAAGKNKEKETSKRRHAVARDSSREKDGANDADGGVKDANGEDRERTKSEKRKKKKRARESSTSPDRKKGKKKKSKKHKKESKSKKKTRKRYDSESRSADNSDGHVDRDGGINTKKSKKSKKKHEKKQKTHDHSDKFASTSSIQRPKEIPKNVAAPTKKSDQYSSSLPKPTTRNPFRSRSHEKERPAPAKERSRNRSTRRSRTVERIRNRSKERPTSSRRNSTDRFRAEKRVRHSRSPSHEDYSKMRHGSCRSRSLSAPRSHPQQRGRSRSESVGMKRGKRSITPQSIGKGSLSRDEAKRTIKNPFKSVDVFDGSSASSRPTISPFTTTTSRKVSDYKAKEKTMSSRSYSVSSSDSYHSPAKTRKNSSIASPRGIRTLLAHLQRGEKESSANGESKRHPTAKSTDTRRESKKEDADKRRRRSRSISARHGKRSQSMDVRRGKDSPSMDLKRRKRSPSVEDRRRKRSPSVKDANQHRKRSSSMDARRGKDSTSVDAKRRKQSPSMETQRRKSSPSSINRRRKHSPSANTPSMNVKRRELSPSVEARRCKRSPSGYTERRRLSRAMERQKSRSVEKRGGVPLRRSRSVEKRDRHPQQRSHSRPSTSSQKARKRSRSVHSTERKSLRQRSQSKHSSPDLNYKTRDRRRALSREKGKSSPERKPSSEKRLKDDVSKVGESRVPRSSRKRARLRSRNSSELSYSPAKRDPDRYRDILVATAKKECEKPIKEEIKDQISKSEKQPLVAALTTDSTLVDTIVSKVSTATVAAAESAARHSRSRSRPTGSRNRHDGAERRTGSRSRSSHYSSSHSRSSRSRSHSHSSQSSSSSRSSSRSSSSDSSATSRTGGSRSPSIPRRRGSPSFLDRRRITSARKRPIPYHRKTPSDASSYCSSCYSRESSPHSPSRSPTRSSRSPSALAF